MTMPAFDIIFSCGALQKVLPNLTPSFVTHILEFIKFVIDDVDEVTFLQFLNPSLKHTARNLHFLSKNSTFPRKLSIFWGRKTRENVVVLDFLAVDNFDFTRKIVKKKKFG